VRLNCREKVADAHLFEKKFFFCPLKLSFRGEVVIVSQRVILRIKQIFNVPPQEKHAFFRFLIP